MPGKDLGPMICPVPLYHSDSITMLRWIAWVQVGFLVATHRDLPPTTDASIAPSFKLNHHEDLTTSYRSMLHVVRVYINPHTFRSSIHAKSGAYYA